jgi:hypothetical protein
MPIRRRLSATLDLHRSPLINVIEWFRAPDSII